MPKQALRLLTVCAVATSSACFSESTEIGAERLDALSEGISKDSLYAILGNGPLTGQYSDTLRIERGFRRDVYLINGKQYEVVYYRELQGNVAEPIQQAKETPVVLETGKIIGWGWKYYVEAMETLKLPNPAASAKGGNASSPATEPPKRDTFPDTLKANPRA